MLSALDKCNKPSSVCQSLTVSLRACPSLQLSASRSLSLSRSLSFCLSVCLSVCPPPPPPRHRHQTLSAAALVHRRRPLRFLDRPCPLCTRGAQVALAAAK